MRGLSAEWLTRKRKLQTQHLISIDQCMWTAAHHTIRFLKCIAKGTYKYKWPRITGNCLEQRSVPFVILKSAVLFQMVWKITNSDKATLIHFSCLLVKLFKGQIYTKFSAESNSDCFVHWVLVVLLQFERENVFFTGKQSNAIIEYRV